MDDKLKSQDKKSWEMGWEDIDFKTQPSCGAWQSIPNLPARGRTGLGSTRNATEEELQLAKNGDWS